MKVIKGDLWTVESDAIVITTNMVVKNNGELVMGAGVAKQALDRFPDIAKYLGTATRNNQLVAVYRNGDSKPIVSLPTKDHWKDKSIPELIERSIQELVNCTNSFKWKNVVLPPPGCGLGGLKWKEVEPLISKYLDDRFSVVLNK